MWLSGLHSPAWVCLFVILMFLPATASIKRLLTPLAPWLIVILPPSPKVLHLINTDNHACTGIHSLPYRFNRNPPPSHMHMTHIHRAHMNKPVNSFSHTLTGVDAFAVTDLLKAQAGQIHASLISQRMLLWKCLQLSLNFFFFFSFHFLHTLPILKTFTHNIQHSIHLHNRRP